MTVVFLSFAGAEPREPSQVTEWARRLRAAGFEVIDHERFTSYDLIMTDIARCDAMVAPVRWHGSTWASIEHSSAAAGRDTCDGSRGSWPPKPVLFWRVPDDDPHDPLTGMGGCVWAFRTGNAVALPGDFELAVARAVEIIRAIGSESPTA